MTKQEAQTVLQKDRRCNKTKPAECALLYGGDCKSCPKYSTETEVREAHRIIDQ